MTKVFEPNETYMLGVTLRLSGFLADRRRVLSEADRMEAGRELMLGVIDRMIRREEEALSRLPRRDRPAAVKSLLGLKAKRQEVEAHSGVLSLH